MTVTVTEAIETLRAAGVPSAEHDARALARHAAEAGAELAELVQRRAARTPLQHLIGTTGFRYLELQVGPGVFVPRPESELVAGAAIEYAAAAGPAPLVVDLCSGSGAIALSVAAEVPGATVHAVELDPGAARWLRRNVEATGHGDRVHVHEGDIATALPDLDGTVDVVVANPPYVATEEMPLVDPEVRDHDPVVALVAADDGLAVIRVVAAVAARLLAPGRHLVVEHSDRQGTSAPAVLVEHGFVDVADHPDLTGRPRFATGRRTG